SDPAPFCYFLTRTTEVGNVLHHGMDSARSSPAGQAPAVEGSCPRPVGHQANQVLLEEMLGTVAHELRGPLATIHTGVGLLGATCELDPSARQTLALMEAQLRQTVRLVDDLFDLCAGGLGKLSLCKEVVALADVVARATEATGPLLAARRHRLT